MCYTGMARICMQNFGTIHCAILEEIANTTLNYFVNCELFSAVDDGSRQNKTEMFTEQVCDVAAYTGDTPVQWAMQLQQWASYLHCDKDTLRWAT